MTKTEWVLGGVCWILIWGSVWALIWGLPMIHKWEREAGYPYGKLCEYVGSCR